VVKIIEQRDIDEKGHGHVVVVEGLGDRPIIVCNIYSPVRSLAAEQEVYYERVGKVIEELEIKYINREPGLIILGDFNLPLEQNMNKNIAEQNRALNLSEYFASLGLIDCWKKGDDRITHRTGESRLDRIMFRLNGKHDEILQTDWAFTTSDHCLLQLTLQKKFKIPSRRTVSLPTYILECKTDVEYIENGMTEFFEMCSDQWSASMRLEFMKTSLRTLAGECVKYRNRREREELDRIQRELQSKMVMRGSVSLHSLESRKEEIEQLFIQRNTILERKCEALASKVKTKWFHEGERSNKYFLNLLRRRNAMIEIEALETAQGVTKNWTDIKREITAFYKNLYEDGGDSESDTAFYNNITKVKVVEANKVTMPLSKDEIYETLKTCKDSAPGPDGIPYSYYKKFWKFFGDTLTQAWNESLVQGTLPPSHCASLLRLLPKEGKDLTHISNWRPITLSNCDHKLITKCYAKRLTNILRNVLHPNQTAYLPGKQIQDNLRVINIIKENCPKSVIMALDARKAFDSVNHNYIRDTLTAYGLENFIPIFNILYKNQKVDIAVNGDVIEGYQIKNGVKQGDALSCILFILSIDPLIWNVEKNDQISRIGSEDFVAPKIVAYADDVTCLSDSTRSIKYIFKEYERLSKASGLVLNADKTEILTRAPKIYRISYLNKEYRIVGKNEAKINGIIFNSDSRLMKAKNYLMLKDKIVKALTGWQTRGLSLLGRILIYKTFGLSQVIYLMTVLDLELEHYKIIDQLFYNFIWNKNLNGHKQNNRISREKLCKPIELGGFGMLNYKEVVNSIRCRQLGKMFDDSFNHPLKRMVIIEDKKFMSGRCINKTADSVAKDAFNLIFNNTMGKIGKISNEEILGDECLLQQMGEIDIVHTIKVRWRESREAITLVHQMNIENIREAIVQASQNRRVLNICKKVIRAKYLRVIKLATQNNIVCQESGENRIKLITGKYQILSKVTSKEFRLLLGSVKVFNKCRYLEDLDELYREGISQSSKKASQY